MGLSDRGTKRIDAALNKEYMTKAEMDWLASLNDPHHITGVRQPSVYPVESAVLRKHSIGSVTANASGQALIHL